MGKDMDEEFFHESGFDYHHVKVKECQYAGNTAGDWEVESGGCVLRAGT